MRRWVLGVTTHVPVLFDADAGGVRRKLVAVFSGSDEGNFFALDAKTGKPLWDFQTGGAIAANPVSFRRFRLRKTCRRRFAAQMANLQGRPSACQPLVPPTAGIGSRRRGLQHLL
jgi:glucose dehydrogenase